LDAAANASHALARRESREERERKKMGEKELLWSGKWMFARASERVCGQQTTHITFPCSKKEVQQTSLTAT